MGPFRLNIAEVVNEIECGIATRFLPEPTDEPKAACEKEAPKAAKRQERILQEQTSELTKSETERKEKKKRWRGESHAEGGPPNPEHC
jgi:hypothetical protein